MAGVVEGAAKGGAVLAQEGPGLVSAGVKLASQLIKVWKKYISNFRSNDLF